MHKIDSGSSKKIPEEDKIRSSPVVSVSKPKVSQSESLYEEYKLRKCSVRWKNITLKCAGPKCGLIDSNHVYVAQIASGTFRPRYILLCKRHRDVTNPEVYDHLSQRLGNIISLRKDPINLEESESEMSDKETLKNESVSVQGNKRKSESVTADLPNPKKKVDVHEIPTNDKGAKEAKAANTTKEIPQVRSKLNMALKILSSSLKKNYLNFKKYKLPNRTFKILSKSIIFYD